MHPTVKNVVCVLLQIGRMMGMLARISDSGLTWIWQERAWRRMRAQLESR